MKQIEKTIRFLAWFITRPLVGFVSYLVVVGFVVFAPRDGPNLLLFYLVLPWLILVVLALNLSFVSLVFRRFTLSNAKKKNHALEHGTIFFLRKRYGGKVRVGGSAESDGFRIYGVQQKEHLVKAFDDLLRELKQGSSELIVSMRCGSNIATAQGLAIVLLTLAAVILSVSKADPMTSLIFLSATIFLYFLLRTRLGNWVQSMFFMSLDFSNARIQSVYKVEKKRFWERNPVFFVKTVIS